MSVLVEFCRFDVIGRPYPQGSKVPFNARNGQARMKESGGAGHAAWRNAVAEKARDVARTITVPAPLDGPLMLDVKFRFPATSSWRKDDRIRGWRWKDTAPDTSKLVRALEDGLQAAGLIVDDARFVVVRASKIETTGWVGATVSVERAP